jgi:PQQ-dependent catabolism-associated beta-propeller protein
MVHWIDTSKGELVDNTLVGQRPRHAEFSPDGKTLWVSSELGGTVTILDVATRQPIKTLSFEIKGIKADQIQPVGIRLSPDGKRAYIALGPANHVAVVDAQSYETLDTLLVGRRVWHMEISPDGKRLFTSNGVSGDVSVINLADLSVVKSIKVGRYPWGVAIVP